MNTRKARTSITMDLEVLEKLKALALSSDRSVSSLIEEAVETLLSNKDTSND